MGRRDTESTAVFLCSQSVWAAAVDVAINRRAVVMYVDEEMRGQLEPKLEVYDMHALPKLESIPALPVTNIPPSCWPTRP